MIIYLNATKSYIFSLFYCLTEKDHDSFTRAILHRLLNSHAYSSSRMQTCFNSWNFSSTYIGEK